MKLRVPMGVLQMAQQKHLSCHSFPFAEYLTAGITTGGKSLVVTIGAEDAVIFAAERLVDQGNFAHATQEAVLVPVFLLVGEVFAVDTDRFAAFVAVRMLVTQDIPLASKRLFTIPALECRHRLAAAAIPAQVDS
ncbi:hypothetical protein T10_1699 [Trichinella papuae]|uniref:Uncharacterized protein n=1 Tax=Trichinella papuae TaxID=268474 RepID=A0A0V1N4U4_9BILA|nr:hypothetical protein T10_1699 [Trichinella papuae]